MQLNVEPDVYERFHKLKKLHRNAITESEFLSLMITHIQNCQYGGENGPQNDPKLQNGYKGPDAPIRPCPECKFAAGNKGQLWDHFETIHADSGSFSCTCGNSYSRLPSFLKHYVDCPVAATDLQDPRPSVSFSRRQRMHRFDRFKKEADDFGEYAGFSPSEIGHPYRHPPFSAVAGPSADKPYGCPKCLKGFKNKSLLDQHMHLHYPPRYKCRWCGNVYRWPPVYYHHKQKCKKRPLITTMCNQSLNEMRVSTSNDHIVRGEDSHISNNQLALAQQALAQFINIQNMPFSQHDVDLEAKRKAAMSNGETNNHSLACLCAENFENVQSYFEHVGTCTNVVPTSTLESITSETLSSVSTACVNIPEQGVSRLVNEGSSLFKSPTFKTVPLYRSSIASGIYSCSTCCKEFTSKLSLKQHVDGKHRAEGKYLCQSCGKRYRWGASFYYHKKTCMLSGPPGVIDTQARELLATHS